MPKGKCTIEDCGLSHYCRGWCQKHYTRWARHGDPMLTRRTLIGAALAFVYAHVNDPHDDADPCVLWPEGWATASGYGKVRFNGRQENASRVLLELRDGPPIGREVAHGPCHDRRCIVHVRWATRSSNEGDKVRDGTVIRGERHPHAKLTEAQVRDIRRRVGNGERSSVIAARFGVSKSTVKGIKHRRSWAWLEAS